MYQLLWTCLGFFINPRRTIKILKKYPSHYLLGYGLIISISSILSFYFGEMHQLGTAPQTIFVKLISYYIFVFLFLSVVITTILFIRKEIYLKKFLGVYFISDFPLLMILPLSLILIAFPFLSFIIKIIISIISFFVLFLKLYVITECLKVQIPQAILLLLLPFVLVFLLVISFSIGIYNQLIMYF